MRLLILTFLALSLAFTSYGQNSFKRNTIYFELGGNGLFTSLHYERQIFKEPRLAFHAGAGMYGLDNPYLTIPFGVNYMQKFENIELYLELGFGATYSKADVTLYAIVDHGLGYVHTHYWNYIPHTAFRKVTKKNMVYRLAWSPVFNHNTAFLFFGGFSIGKSF